MLEHLQALGLCHVEFAWQPGSGVAWGRELAELEAAVSAGCPYAVSPILERALQRRAAAAGARVLSSSFPPSVWGLATGSACVTRSAVSCPSRSLPAGLARLMCGPGCRPALML
jgi:hypothetical protein